MHSGVSRTKFLEISHTRQTDPEQSMQPELTSGQAGILSQAGGVTVVFRKSPAEQTQTALLAVSSKFPTESH